MKQLHWITSKSMTSMFYQSANFLIWKISGVRFMYYRIARKFAGEYKFNDLVVYLCNCQIKTRQHFLLEHICMAIPYWTAKFKSANIFSMAILGPTTKFYFHQYYRLCGMPLNHSVHVHIAPHYITKPTRHDYVVQSRYVSLKIFGLTKLQMLFVVCEGNLSLGLSPCW